MEVRLDRVQLVWLSLGLVVAMGLMFAFGFVVGQRAAGTSSQTQPSDPLARADRAQDLRKDLKFYEQLAEKDKGPKSPKPSAAKGASQQRKEPQSEADTPSRSAESEPDNGEQTAAQQAATTAGERRRSATAEQQQSASSIRAALDAGPAKPGDYTVQVSAFQSRAEAEAFAASLERKGFKPFIVRSELADKGTWFRVRLGRFSEKAEAKKAKAVLAGEAIPAWVVKME